jgi:hypothetical protein
MIGFSSRGRVARLVLVSILACAVTPLLASSASADPSQAEVVGACSRTKGCNFEKQPGGEGIIGCSPHACFSCNGVTCHQLPKIKRPVTGTARGGSSAGGASANLRRADKVTAGASSSGGIHHSAGGRH